MATVQLGQEIAQLRRDKAITQQTLADFLGVSKASVSKWENGQSYPDITLLPLIAAYFGISIDTLMRYDAQLSQKQIRTIYTQLSKAFTTRPAATVLTDINNLTRRYYSCEPLLFEIGQLLLNHYDLLPGADAQTRTQTYVPQARALFQRVQQLAIEAALVTKAHSAEAYCDLILNEPDKVLALLGETMPEYFPNEALIAWAHQAKGERVAAVTTTQAAIYQYIVVLLSQLTNYVQLLADQPVNLQRTIARGQALIQAFHIDELNPVAVVNFLTSSAMGCAASGEGEQAVALLTQYADLLTGLRLPLELHGDVYFDQIDDWLTQMDLGHQLPRSAAKLQLELADIPFQVPPLAALLAQPGNEALTQRFHTLKEALSHA